MFLQVRGEDQTGLFGLPLVHQHGGARKRRRGGGRASAEPGARAEQQQRSREHPRAMLALSRRQMSMQSTDISNDIKSVAVVGAGQMGAGIAQVAARAGLDVCLSDQAESPAAQAVSTLEARLRRQEGEGKVPAGATSELTGRIRTGGPLFGVAE